MKCVTIHRIDGILQISGMMTFEKNGKPIMRHFSVENESIHLLTAPQYCVLFSAQPSSPGYFYVSISGSGCLSVLF